MEATGQASALRLERMAAEEYLVIDRAAGFRSELDDEPIRHGSTTRGS